MADKFPELFDVVEIEIASPHTERLIAERKDKANAEAIVKMAVARRGVKTSFFTIRSRSLIEHCAKAIYKQFRRHGRWEDPGEERAKDDCLECSNIVLRASGHAELVAALVAARPIIAELWGTKANPDLLAQIDAALAKVKSGHPQTGG